MIRIIETENLRYDSRTGRIYRRFGTVLLLPALGRPNKMPRGLTLYLIQEWDEIEEMLEQDVLSTTE